jgi:bacteriorhodopsin
MNLRNLFRLISILQFAMGLIWLLAPKAMPAALYDMEIDSYSAFLFQQLGAINIALAVLFFLVSGLAHSPARQAVVTFVVVLQILSTIAYVPALLDGVLPAAAWGGVALSLAIAAAFAYFGYIRPEAMVVPELQS